MFGSNVVIIVMQTTRLTVRLCSSYCPNSKKCRFFTQKKGVYYHETSTCHTGTKWAIETSYLNRFRLGSMCARQLWFNMTIETMFTKETRLTRRNVQTKITLWNSFWLTVCSYHVTYAFQSEYTLYLSQHQGTPCSKQARNLNSRFIVDSLRSAYVTW